MAFIGVGLFVAMYLINARASFAIGAFLSVFTLVTDTVFSVVVTHIFMKVRTLQLPPVRAIRSF
jgi:hypothetical protein